MTKRANLGLKTLFFTKSCSLPKTDKKVVYPVQNVKTFCSWAENSDLQRLVHFVELANKWCGRAKMTKRANLGLKKLFCTTILPLAENC